MHDLYILHLTFRSMTLNYICTELDFITDIYDAIENLPLYNAELNDV